MKYEIIDGVAFAILLIDKDGFTHHCPFCHEFHKHGINTAGGHRSAHCNRDSVNFKSEIEAEDGTIIKSIHGYILKPSGY